jgi:hypothetical protein
MIQRELEKHLLVAWQLNVLRVHTQVETFQIIGGTLARLCKQHLTFINFFDSWFLIRFLYILYISVDANFKLKSKDRGLKDVELMPGWGPFVEESAYQDFISNYVDQPEVSILCYLIREH